MNVADDLISSFQSALSKHDDAVLVVKTVAHDSELLEITAGDSGADLLEQRSLPTGRIAALLGHLDVPPLFDVNYWHGVVELNGMSLAVDLARADNGGMHLRLTPIRT